NVDACRRAGRGSEGRASSLRPKRVAARLLGHAGRRLADLADFLVVFADARQRLVADDEDGFGRAHVAVAPVMAVADGAAHFGHVGVLPWVAGSSEFPAARVFKPP